jgi:hypothetical protein
MPVDVFTKVTVSGATPHAGAGIKLATGATIGVLVQVDVGVKVDVGVGSRVDVSVAVGVMVAVPVAVVVAVPVAVVVAVPVLVAVVVTVPVWVIVGVGVIVVVSDSVDMATAVPFDSVSGKAGSVGGALLVACWVCIDDCVACWIISSVDSGASVGSSYVKIGVGNQPKVAISVRVALFSYAT